MDWKSIPKIDAHVHLLPPEILKGMKQDDPTVWGHADMDEFKAVMDEYNVRKAVLVPINEPYTYFKDPDETNAWLAGLVKEDPERFTAFADVVNNGGYFHEFAPAWLETAVKEHDLKGLKLHPSNLGMAIDSLEMVPVIRKAAELGVPVMVHSYPYGRTDYDSCAPHRIHRMSRIFPDCTFILSHMGGARWQDALEGTEYVDISTFLPELVSLYGVEQSNRILRAFGADRLIFATDYPQVYLCKPENVYTRYCEILDQMDFTEDEAEKIAYRNISKLLGSN